MALVFLSHFAHIVYKSDNFPVHVAVVRTLIQCVIVVVRVVGCNVADILL